MSGPDRGRGLGAGLQPPGAPRGRGARRARRRDRPRLRRSGRARRSTGRRSRGSTRPSCPAAPTTPSHDALDGRPAGRRRPGRLHADRRAARSSRAFAGRILNTHPSLLPAFPGAHAVRDALAHGVEVTGATVHLVDATLDGGPIVAQEAVPIAGRRRRGDAPRADPGRRAPAPAAGRRAAPRRCHRGAAPATRRTAARRRAAPSRAARPAPGAPVGLRQDRAWPSSARGLVAAGFELVSTGGTARALREAGLPVTDVAAVTGSPEMLDGRVKTLHPRIHAGILADRRLADHRRQLVAAGIAPFELVVVNLYPFAAAAERPGDHVRRARRGDRHRRAVDGPGGGQEPRQRRDRDLAGPLPGDPRRARRAAGRVPAGLRSALAIEAFRHTAAYDARIAAELPGRMAAAGVDLPDEPGLPGRADPFPPSLTIGLEKVETLRYGENPHQPAARYRRPGHDGRRTGRSRPATPPLQGKALSYNNVLDASAAAALGRALRGPAVRHRQAHEPVRRGRAADAPRGLGRGARRRSGLGVRRRRRAHPPGRRARPPRASRASSSRSSSRPASTTTPARSSPPSRTCGWSSTRCSAADDAPAAAATRSARSGRPAAPSSSARPTPRRTTRRRGRSRPRRAPTDAERRDLDLAWRLVRGVTSNAIVARPRRPAHRARLRPDLARRRRAAGGREGPRDLRRGLRSSGRACASDAFFPFPDAVEACLDGRRHGVRPARRLDARRRGDRRGGRGRRDDARSPACRHFRH